MFSLRQFKRRWLIAVPVAGTAVGLAASAALAFSGTWTYLPGGDFTVTNVGYFLVNAGDTSVTCYEAETKGHANIGSGLSGDEIAEIDYVRLGGFDGDPNTCEGPSGLGVSISVSLPLYFSATSFDVSAGTAHGVLTMAGGSGIRVEVAADDGCVATFGGPGPGGDGGKAQSSYTNSTGEFAFEGNNLEVISTNGMCNNDLIAVGDKAGLKGRFKPDTKQTITSP